jgi:TPR repeat protein
VRACDGNIAAACYNLALQYERGLGATKQRDRAKDLFEQSCKGGDQLACDSLALRYRNGDGVPQDKSRAALLFEHACFPGDSVFANATENGAMATTVRCDVESNTTCGAAAPSACDHLGVMLIEGDGVLPDPKRAVELMQHACDLNWGDGCYNAGIVMIDGKHRPADRGAAEVFFRKACELKVQDACNNVRAMQAQ